MCYDVSFTATLAMIADYLPSLEIDPQLYSYYEPLDHVVAQSYLKRPVVVQEDGRLRLRLMEWGLIPAYMNSREAVQQGRSSMCNAQSEKLLDPKAYWYRIRGQRCLVPARGFFEHREIKGWKTKVPYYITPRNRDLFCFLGLYNDSPLPDPETGEVTTTFTLLTRAANPVMAQIHNGGARAGRMPLLVPKELEQQWLDPTLDTEALRQLIAYEWPAEALVYHPVHTIRTTKERPDGGGKADPFDWPGLPPLGGEAQLSLL